MIDFNITFYLIFSAVVAAYVIGIKARRILISVGHKFKDVLKMINRALACLLLLLVSACSDPVKEELTKYINKEIPPVAEMGNDLMVSHTAARGAVQQAESDEAIVQAWGVALTKCRKHEEAVSAISLKLHTPEVRDLHEILIEAANKICTGMLTQLDAMDKDDLNLMNQANAQLNDAQKIQRKWQSQLENLKKDHHI